MVAGETARNPGRSGIQTVVRSLATAFGRRRAPVRLANWNSRNGWLRPLPLELGLGPDTAPLYDPATRFPLALLGQPGAWYSWLRYGGKGKFVPLHLHPLHRQAPPGTWVLLPELMYRGAVEPLIDYVREHRWRLAAIFYDTIPVDRPDLVPPELPGLHSEYMRALSRADLILPISEFAADGWRAFVARTGLPSPPVRTCALACDFVGTPRIHTLPPVHEPGRPMRMLCVSTLEPRKNHDTMLAAYELALTRRPHLALKLDLVGASHIAGADIANRVRSAAARLPGLRWHEQVEYSNLQALYGQCDFTVYPSILEGFGLPVLESLWQGRPCICADFGVMAENAIGGGCLTTDTHNPEALASAILSLVDSPGLRHQLTVEALERPLKTWGEYADEILAVLPDAAQWIAGERPEITAGLQGKSSGGGTGKAGAFHAGCQADRPFKDARNRGNVPAK